MGAYDLQKISGDIRLRFGKPKESIVTLGQAMNFPVEDSHVVYTDNDDQRIISTLWNYKDSDETKIDSETTDAVFFIDQAFYRNEEQMEEAVSSLQRHLIKFGAEVCETEVASMERPEISISHPNPKNTFSITRNL